MPWDYKKIGPRVICPSKPANQRTSRPADQRTSKPATFIVDCWIFNVIYKSLEKDTLFFKLNLICRFQLFILNMYSEFWSVYFFFLTQNTITFLFKYAIYFQLLARICQIAPRSNVRPKEKCLNLKVSLHFVMHWWCLQKLKE